MATRIIEALDVPWVVLLSMDSFYKVSAARCDTAQHGVTRHSMAQRGAEWCRCPQVLDEGQQALAARSDYNFDHPDAFDFELLVSVLRKLKKGKSVKVPVYDFTTHSRRREWVGAVGTTRGVWGSWGHGEGSAGDSRHRGGVAPWGVDGGRGGAWRCWGGHGTREHRGESPQCKCGQDRS